MGAEGETLNGTFYINEDGIWKEIPELSYLELDTSQCHVLSEDVIQICKDDAGIKFTFPVPIYPRKKKKFRKYLMSRGFSRNYVDWLCELVKLSGDAISYRNFFADWFRMGNYWLDVERRNTNA